MIDIQWKGKIGYGDIVSPVCYAHNLSFKLKTEVNLTFRWQNGSSHKIHRTDPETLWERADYIAAMCEERDTVVNIEHRFHDPLNINHTNYDWTIVGKDVYHNYWRPKVFNQLESKTIVVNSTDGNTTSLKTYGKPWKDPIARQWGRVVDTLSKQYNVVVVDYRTPINELVALLQTAKGFVGYHGTAAWVAKFTHTPSILFADGGSLTRNAFPYAHIESDPARLDNVLINISKHFLQNRDLIKKCRQAYLLYKPNTAFIESLKYEL